MAAMARQRLMEERKLFRKNRAFGFAASPTTLPDGTQNLMKWECLIPGKDGTIWADASFPLTIIFTDQYPVRAPVCKFPQGFFHPNVFPCGTVCLSILNDEYDWQPGISVQQILSGIQDLLDTPNLLSPAQEAAYSCYKKDRAAYNRKVQTQTRSFALVNKPT